MKQILFTLCLLTLGCGYTTKAFIGSGTIYVKPVENNIQITREKRAYSDYQSYPILIEKQLTNAVVDEFRIRSNYTITSNNIGVNTLECSIIDYKREALQYDDFDEVTEQRLRLHVKFKYYNAEEVLKEKTIVGEASYYLEGTYATSESDAFEELIEDTARRIVEAIADDW